VIVPIFAYEERITMHLVVTLPIDEKRAFVAASLTNAKGSWSEQFNRGTLFSGKVPPLVVTTSEDYGSKFLDAVPNRSLELIVSQRLKEVLQGLGLTKLQFFPLKITDWDSGAKHEHWVCNVVGTIACLDRKRAEVHWDASNPNKVFMLQRLAIDESAIKAFNEARKPEEQLKIFRLEEYPRYLLASADIAKAVTDSGVEGIEFRKPEECGDFL
jgi:hypothetical protein